MNLKIAAALFAVLAPLAVGAAAAQTGECSGTLHVANGSIQFGGRQGESEGICVVARSDRRKILASCAAGAFCRVKGRVAPCRGSGECTEISRIGSVTRH